jgi:hypothetical protein
MSERKGRSHQHIWTGNLSDLSVSLKPVEVAAQPAILMYSPQPQPKTSFNFLT